MGIFCECLPFQRFATVFFVYIHEKISTIGTMKSVLVSLTIVVREPAASENAYPAATTEDVSLTEVLIQSPYPVSPIPKTRPIQGEGDNG